MTLTLGACLIVKNEEKFLADCLDSLKDVVSEIVVLDTGSTDSSVDIAKRYSDKVFHWKWRDSFADARNESLKHSTTDWVLVIDADERLENDDAPLLLESVENSGADVISLLCVNLKGKCVDSLYFDRLIRRGVTFYGDVHERARYTGTRESLDVRIYHLGYNPDLVDMAAKLKRREEALVRQLEKTPLSGYDWTQLCRVYRCQSLWPKVIDAGRKGLMFCRGASEFQMILLDVGCAYLAMRQFYPALGCFQRMLRRNILNLDAVFYSAETFRILGEKKKAWLFYKEWLRILDTDRNDVGLIVETIDRKDAVEQRIVELTNEC